MAQLYRDIELGTVWEGSGNVIALDVLRAIAREPERVAALPGRVRARRRRRRALRRSPALAARALLESPADLPEAEWRARRLVEDMALALQASLLAAPPPPGFVSAAFCAGRLEHRGLAFGDLPRGVDGPAIVKRALAL